MNRCPGSMVAFYHQRCVLIKTYYTHLLIFFGNWTATNEGKVIYESAKYIIALSWREREKRRGKKQIRKLKIELRNENRTASRIIAADTHIYPTRLFIHTYICIRNTLPLGSFDTVSILSLSLSSVKRERDRKTKEWRKKPINQPFALRDRNPKLAYFI